MCDYWLVSAILKYMKHSRKNTFPALMSHLLPGRNIGVTRMRRLLKYAGNSPGRRAFQFLSPVQLGVLALGGAFVHLLIIPVER